MNCNRHVTTQNCQSQQTEKKDSGTYILPHLFPEKGEDMVFQRLRNEAFRKTESYKFPDNIAGLTRFSDELREKIIKKTGVVINHSLPLEIHETKAIHLKDYIIKNIYFQVRDGIYATGNLYIPEGEGPFPAVLHTPGHWDKSKMDAEMQKVGHSLALNGYVCLTIDPWGAGERSMIQGHYDYHGANLGASLMNIGESLMGAQISDNIRAVDLLSSLPYVDPSRIGATGASGGGSQVLWLAAVDQRVKAIVPVVSSGTFEAFVMRRNCVCELLPDGLTFTEEAGVIASIAPRAIKMISHAQDANPAFSPLEMMKSYNRVKPVFNLMKAENKIDYQIIDLPHGYFKQDRESMLGWFDYHLKGRGSGKPKEEPPIEILDEKELMVFLPGTRPAEVINTLTYCHQAGSKLRTEFLQHRKIHVHKKKQELLKILRVDFSPKIKNIQTFPSTVTWERIVLETTDNKKIPLLIMSPANKNTPFNILIHAEGKQHISPDLIHELELKGEGIVVTDLSGTGEVASATESTTMKRQILHTQARAELWLGKTILGEWTQELGTIVQYLQSNRRVKHVVIDATKEAGLAALFTAIVYQSVDSVVLRNAPISYLCDSQNNVDYFNMAIHLPGILEWGDISLASAIAKVPVTFIDPVSVQGIPVCNDQLQSYKTEYDLLRKRCGTKAYCWFKEIGDNP
ncbi:MAG: acetylxylan esterase [Bacteroidales bacterium]